MAAMGLERFTDRIRKVMQLADHEAHASPPSTLTPSTSCSDWSRKDRESRPTS